RIILGRPGSLHGSKLLIVEFVVPRKARGDQLSTETIAPDKIVTLCCWLLDSQSLEVLGRHSSSSALRPRTHRLPQQYVGVLLGRYALTQPLVERRFVVNVPVFVERPLGHRRLLADGVFLLRPVIRPRRLGQYP